ncbi:substrate-binding periplasmic protein [Motilimonas cestriensis]|uniref:substrate-binding periplasmic protein n=1 Tax=Motilimonas cestriensis TaxID=2742685 RepID=UPI003DA5A152
MGIRIFFSIIFLLSNTAQSESLRLVMPQFPPYTSEVDGQISGLGVELVKDVFTRLKTDYQLRTVPNYARAIEEVRLGRADGFFLASENTERSRIAVFSEPLLMNHWAWFMRKDDLRDPTSEAFKHSGQVATLLGSNTNHWLLMEGYNVLTKANEVVDLPTMLLDMKRIDAVFLAERVFTNELARQQYSVSDYRRQVQLSKPFGIYIAKSYVAKHPQFMMQLNKQIKLVQDLK